MSSNKLCLAQNLPLFAKGIEELDQKLACME